MKRIVIKVGSCLVTNKDGSINKDYITNLSKQINKIRQKNCEIIIVTSGAIASGLSKLPLKYKPKTLQEKQALAAVGQPLLMQTYEECFSKCSIPTAQVLLTREDFEIRNRYLNARDTIINLLNLKVVPIINENDTVATEEIRLGDNDMLAAIISSTFDADLFIILTNVDGLYTDDPAINKDAKLIKEVKEITPEIENIAKKTTSISGTGGMYTKIQAAKISTSSNIETVIANGMLENVVIEIEEGNEVGTKFFPVKKILEAKKKWIAFTTKVKGKIFIDDGAVDAIKNKGKSLLPSGIISCEGNFSIGDTVSIVDRFGKEVARGLCYYSKEDVEKIKGKKTSQIPDLAYEEVVHRNNLVLL